MDTLFVPGGRVYKNESINDAIERVSKEEIGLSFTRADVVSLGVWQHDYAENAYDKSLLNALHCIPI